MVGRAAAVAAAGAGVACLGPLPPAGVKWETQSPWLVKTGSVEVAHPPFLQSSALCRVNWGGGNLPVVTLMLPVTDVVKPVATGEPPKVQQAEAPVTASATARFLSFTIPP